jgi:ribosome-associated protein
MRDGEPVSKSELKRRMHELQRLGVALVELRDEQLAAIALPERLREAVIEARRIASFEARRRQLQYIGRLMREVDAEPIRAALAALRGAARLRSSVHARAEAWRERLIAEPAALAQLLASHPDADARRLRSLARGARRERESGAPPRSFRELFRALRELFEKDAAGGA